MNLRIIFLLLYLMPMLLFSANGKILEASKSVIRIITVLDDDNMVSGTAFSINEDGYFLTNAHVVDGAESIFAIKSSGKYDVKVINKFNDVDLAILKIENTGLKPLSFAFSNNIKVTDVVSSIGFPGAADQNENLDELTTVTINSGIIGKLTSINLSIIPENITSKFSVVQHDAVVNHGNSGGPLVNECGQVVGINVQKGLSENRSLEEIVVGDVVQGIFYAIDIDIAKRVLEESHISFLEIASDCSQGSTSMSVDERKYLIIGGILLALLAIWSIIFYTQENKNKNKVVNESVLSHLIDQKLRNHDGHEIQLRGSNEYSAKLKPLVGNLPILTIKQGESMVGRSRSATFYLDNPMVSGKHLSLSLNEKNEIIVKDLNSSNGTYIDSRKLSPNVGYIIKKSERLIIGSEDVMYLA